MAPQTPFPPTHDSTLPVPVPPSAAEKTLTRFLSRAPKTPHLHPDAMLSTTGVQFSAHSGPRGGLAHHHLQRIAAGLRGEAMVLETREELEAMFGEGIMGEGDDMRIDGVIGRRERSNERVRAWDSGAGADAIEAQAEDMDRFQKSRGMLEGELGERDGAPVEKQNGTVQAVVEHDGAGNMKREHEDDAYGGDGAGVDRAARNAAKKQRRKEEKQRQKQG